MNIRASGVLTGRLLLVQYGGAASGQETSPAPLYTNAEVISIDPLTRLVVIRNGAGTTETMELDDGMAGAAGVKVGDRVMMTVREAGGRKRISLLTKVNPAPPSTASTTAATPTSADVAETEMRARFTDQVKSLSAQAKSIDQVWSSFVTSCDVTPASSQAGGRDWFGLWDGRVRADLSGGFCRDLFNQIVASGEGVKKGMAAAEEVARKTLNAGEVRDIRALHSMDWDGWTLPAPDQLQP